MVKEENDNMVMEFGTGDIGFNAGAITIDNKKVGIIIFYNQEPRDIGVKGDIESGTEVDLNDFPVRMEFNKKESIDVLITALNIAKNEMD